MMFGKRDCIIGLYRGINFLELYHFFLLGQCVKNWEYTLWYYYAHLQNPSQEQEYTLSFNFNLKKESYFVALSIRINRYIIRAFQVLKKLPGIISSVCIQPLMTAEMLIQARNIYMQTAGTEQDFVMSLIKGIHLTEGRVTLISCANAINSN